MQLPQKQKNFSQFYFACLKSVLNFGNFPKKDDPSYLMYLQNEAL